jgi:DNA-binding NarL/FixJ family response regulator
MIDDHRDFMTAAASILERTGIRVVGMITDSAQALHSVERLQPDVVLIDIDLGRESGFDLAEHLHQHASASTPFTMIMMSARDVRDLTEMLAASPAIGFIDKCFLSGQEVRAVLDDRLRASRKVTTARTRR